MSSENEVVVRPMLAADIDAVVALERRCGTAPHWGREEYVRMVGDPGDSSLRRIALVAEVAGRIAGFAVLRVLLAADGGDGELESIAVAVGQRGRGIGSALLQSAMNAAVGLNVSHIGLEVRESNAAAIGMYRRAGLTEDGLRREYYADTGEAAVLMSVRL